MTRQRGCAARGEPDEQRRSDGERAEQSVAELDEGVTVLRRERMALLAAGPVTTAESRVRQPHGRAGEDDQPQRPELDEDEREQLRRRESEDAPTRTGDMAGGCPWTCHNGSRMAG